MNDAYKHKNDYAVSTFIFENEPLTEAIKEISENGFSTIEIWGDNVHLDPRMELDIKGIRQKLAEYNIDIHSVHTPFRNFPRFHNEQEGRAWRLSLWKKAIDIYSELEIPIAVIHALDRVEYNFGYDQAGYLHDLFTLLSEHARKKGVRLALENIPSGSRPEGERPCTLTEQVKLFGDIKDLYWCLDLGHVAVSGNRVKEEIDCSFERLISFHVHNNDGTKDSHNLPDDGIIDWPLWHDYIREKGYSGQFVLEISRGENPYRQMAKIAALFCSGKG